MLKWKLTIGQFLKDNQNKNMQFASPNLTSEEIFVTQISQKQIHSFLLQLQLNLKIDKHYSYLKTIIKVIIVQITTFIPMMSPGNLRVDQQRVVVFIADV